MTGFVGGGGSCVCEVGIKIISPIEWHLGLVHGWAHICVHLPCDLLLICPPFCLTLLIGHSCHSWHGIGSLSGNLHYLADFGSPGVPTFSKVSDFSLCTFSLSLALTFVFRLSNIPRTSLGNGILLSFSQSCSRHQLFSSISSNVMVMGLHQ